MPDPRVTIGIPRRCRQLHALGDLRRRSRKDHRLGTLLERRGSVEAVRNQILGLGQDSATADDRGQSIDRGRGWRSRCPRDDSALSHQSSIPKSLKSVIL